MENMRDEKIEDLKIQMFRWMGNDHKWVQMGPFDIFGYDPLPDCIHHTGFLFYILARLCALDNRWQNLFWEGFHQRFWPEGRSGHLIRNPIEFGEDPEELDFSDTSIWGNRDQYIPIMLAAYLVPPRNEMDIAVREKIYQRLKDWRWFWKLGIQARHFAIIDRLRNKHYLKKKTSIFLRLWGDFQEIFDGWFDWMDWADGEGSETSTLRNFIRLDVAVLEEPTFISRWVFKKSLKKLDFYAIYRTYFSRMLKDPPRIDLFYNEYFLRRGL